MIDGFPKFCFYGHVITIDYSQLFQNNDTQARI
jgi:hypothetical protein